MRSVRTGELADLLGVHPETIRRYVAAEKIPYHRTPSGQLYFSQSDLDKILGSKNPTEEKWAYYLRSSCGSKTALANQEELLAKSYPSPEYTIKDSASGLNENRRGLAKLVQLAQEGKITHLAVTQRDRLTRFGFSYLEELFRQNGVEVAVLDTQREQSAEEELVDDFMALLASFSGRFYQMRSKENKRKLLAMASKKLEEADD